MAGAGAALYQRVPPRMHILFVSTRRALGQPQSHTVHIWEVLLGLQRLGHRVSLLDGPLPVVESRTCPSLSRRRWFDAATILPDSLQVLLRVGAGALRAIVAVVMVGRTKRTFDVVYGRHSLLPVEWLLGRLLGVPAVKEVNGLEAVEAAMGANIGGWSLQLLDRIERVSLSKADRFVTVTPELGQHLTADLGVDPSDVSVVRNGANTELFRPMDRVDSRSKIGLGENAAVVAFVGNLVGWQSLENLIRCAPAVLARCPDTVFLIVGDGPQREPLETFARDTGVSQSFKFVGAVSYEAVPYYCAASNVCVVCTATEFYLPRGLSPLKLHEYLACARPVVATRVPGFAFLEEIGAGLLVDPENAEEFAEGLLRYMESPDLAADAGARGREYAVANASWGSVSERVARVLAEAVRARLPHGCDTA